MVSDLKGQWYLQLEGERFGPLPAVQLSHYLQLQRLTGENLVSRDGEHWQRLAELPELQPSYRLGIAALPAGERARLEAAAAWVRAHPELFRQEGPGSGNGVAHLKLSRPVARRRGRYHLFALLLAMGVAAIPFLLPERGMMATPQCEAPPVPGVNWEHCQMAGSRLEGAELTGAMLRNTNLNSSLLGGATLRQADLAYANLALADLSGARLQQARLVGANLRNANLQGADLRGADLSYADLTGARLAEANLASARLAYTVWEENVQCMPQSLGECLPARVGE